MSEKQQETRPAGGYPEADLESGRSSGSGDSLKLEKSPTAQDWDGPDDPENPNNWPTGKKIYNTVMPGLLCFAVTFGISVYTPAVPLVAEQFGVSSVVALLPFSLYVIGLGFGPTMAAPVSETWGRVIVYWTSVPVALLFILGAGFSTNLPSLCICRFLAGTFSSPALAVGSGTLVDIWQPSKRTAAFMSYLVGPFLGPVLGPVAGGFTVLNFPWRWTQWDIFFATVPFYVMTLFMKETYKKTILQRRAKRLGIAPPPSDKPGSKMLRFKKLLNDTLIRPVHMMVAEPIVFFFSLYVGFSFATLFAFFAAFPFVFEGIYGFNSGQSGLTFIPIAGGIILAVITGLAIDRFMYVPRHAQAEKEGRERIAPEHRLYTAMIGSIGLPIGLFWFAWTATPSIHWIVPVFAAIPFGWGNLCIFMSAVLYLTDVYGSHLGASALAANGLFRYALGAAFPLFTTAMYEQLGVGWASSIFGFISVALLPIPWVLYKYGPTIRSRSSYELISEHS